MNEPWQDKGPSHLEEFRHIQNLTREGRVEEAMERALSLLEMPKLGRKLEAKIHNLVCRLYTDGYSRPGIAAALHGEEAVRLADLLHDPWLKCEALSQLVIAYCRVGDFDRAQRACDSMQAEADRNPGVVPGGPATAWVLRAGLFFAMGNLEGAASALAQAENLAQEAADGARVLPVIRDQRIDLLLLKEQREEARALLAELDDADPQVQLRRACLAVLDGPGSFAVLAVEAALAQAQADGDQAAVAQALALKAMLQARRGGRDAAGLARRALTRAIAAGRADLARRIRSRLGPLLES